MSIPNLQDIHGLIRACQDCELAGIRNFAVPGFGPPNSDIVIIGEAPGEDENNSLEGQPFIGRSGVYLTGILRDAGISRGDAYLTNTVKCWVGPGNPDPTPNQIAACDLWLNRQLDLIQPRGIITFGKHSTNKFIDFLPKKGIGSVVGVMRKMNWPGGKPCYVMPVYHPAYVMRNRDERPSMVAHLERFREVVMDDDNFGQWA